jgi:mercuric ion binding protein
MQDTTISRTARKAGVGVETIRFYERKGRQEKGEARMRHIVRTVLVLFLAGWAATAVLAAGPSYRLEVAGLACPFCAYGVEKKLNALDGVERVETNIKDGTVIVTMKEGATLDEETAKQAVKDAGFTLDGFEQAPSGDGR